MSLKEAMTHNLVYLADTICVTRCHKESLYYVFTPLREWLSNTDAGRGGGVVEFCLDQGGGVEYFHALSGKRIL